MLIVYPILCREGYMDNYAYIIVDEATGTTGVIDPSDAEPIIAKCETLNLKPQYILNTHHHFDHVEGNLELAQKYGAKIVANSADLHRIKGAEIGLTLGKTFHLGQSSAQILDASAHTIGHIMFYFKEDKILFTGDTLFNLCIGGLFEGTAEQMFAVLAQIKTLPDDVVFYPGHEYTFGGAAAAFQFNRGNNAIKNYLTRARARLAEGLPVAPITLGEEKQCNPYLQAATLEDFKNL